MKTRNLAARAGRWSAQHRKKAVFGWLAFVIVAFALGSAAGTKTIEGADGFNGDSKLAQQIREDAGFSDRATEQVLIQSRGSLTVQDEEFQAAIADVESRLARTPHVVALQRPLSKGHGGQVSGDNRSVLEIFQIAGDTDQAEDRVAAPLAAVAAAQRAHPDLLIEEMGDATASKAFNKSFEDDLKKAETLSLPVTLAILLVAFGALMAAGLPLLLGMSAVMATLGLVGLLSQAWPVDEAVSSVVVLVGLAVGVDYSLFYIRREREERRRGRSEEASLAAAAATSGRAVLVSGLTVMVAMAGMYITGDKTFQSFGTGTIMVVAIAMVGSITVLPALLSKLGDRIDKGRVPLVGRRSQRRGAGGLWSWIIARVLRRPVVAVVLAGGLLVALCIPALGLKTVNSGVNGLPSDLPETQTLDRIEKAFPGGPLPAIVVVKAGDVTSAKAQEAIRSLEFLATATGYMQEPIDIRVNRDKTVAEVSVPLAGNGTDDVSIKALGMLRDDVIPQTLGAAGLESHVAGMTAESDDFNDLMRSRAPWVFAFVLGFAFLLLMTTFRSIVIPITAIVLNLLSVGAAYGVLVLVFQDGRFESLLGYESIDGITSWLPLFLFVILFGLSMDYHVLILSRVREAFDRGAGTEEAVAKGINATAGVVTSAAVVMVGVFGIFATLGALDFKMMGIGLATAVLIDATVVRAVLLPASMKLLGDANWYLPKWLEWLPRVATEASAEPEPATSDLGILVGRDGDRVRVALTGELDLSSAPALTRELERVEAERPATIELDLRRLEFMDSVGIAVLVKANRRAREEGRRLMLLKGEGPIDRILAVARVEDVIDTVAAPAGS
ncbi:MAG TPA: anti-sigma factor antagonist [Thermoleophilaceae bacterium]